MKKQGSMQQKLTEVEYESKHKGGKIFQMQKSLKDLEKLLKREAACGKRCHHSAESCYKRFSMNGYTSCRKL